MTYTVENVIIAGSDWRESDKETLFGDEHIVVREADSLQDLLVKLGCYKSKTQARQAGRWGPIPLGWTDQFKASKKRRLWIWNPRDLTD